MDQPSLRQESMGRTAFELMRVLEKRQALCPICVFVTDAILHHVDLLFYENVNDGSTRDKIRRGEGFCRYHAQMVSNQADALGSAIILEDVLKNVLHDIERGEFTREASPNLLSRLLDGPHNDLNRSGCVICVAETDMENMAVDGLCEAISRAEVADLFGQSHGICVPHFRKVAERHQDQPGWKLVVEVEQRALRDLARHLDELAKSYDYQSTGKPSPTVMQSWREGLNIISSWIDLCHG